MLRTISRFWVVLFCLFSFRTVDPQPIDAFGDVQSLPVGYTISCVGAKQVRYGDLDFCNMISWRTANIYNSTSFSAYEPENGLSARSQDAVARSLVEDILSGSTRHPSSFCRAAVKRFACVAVFPYCPSSGGASSSTSYLPACNRQCMQVHDICKESYFSTESIVPLDCSAYPIDHNCVLNVPKNRFLLLPEQGPYESIPSIYMAMLSLWVVLNCVWSYYAYRVYPESALPVSKALLSLLPIARLLVAAFSLIFWLDCVSTADMCESTRAAIIYIVFPIVEAVQMYVYLAVAKGWGLTRAYLPLDIWRFHIALCFGFYVTLTVLSGTLDVPSDSWIIYSVVLYGVMYLFILRSARQEMSVLTAQVKDLAPGAAAVAAEPLREKFAMFRWFLVLVFFALLLEAVCRYLYAARSAPFYLLVAVYEAGSTLIVVSLCWLYRPREFSPFFFMMPTSLEHNALLVSQEGEEGNQEDAADRLMDEDWRERRERSRVLSRRGHSREREDDVAGIDRLRLSRVQRPSPMVEISLLGGTGEVVSPLEVRRSAEVGPMVAGAGGDIEMSSVAPGRGAAGVNAGVGGTDSRVAQAAESLDLTRLVSTLLVASAATGGAPGQRQQQRAQAAAEMADLGMGGDREGATALSAAPPPAAGAPVSFWRTPNTMPSNRAALPGNTRMIALTSPDQQEVMLAIHRSNPSQL